MSQSSRFQKILLLLACCCIAVRGYAQIQPASSHYMYNPHVDNPAFYGTNEGISFGANYRHQWAKLEGQPRTVTAFADANIPRIHGGVGVVLVNDMLGAYNSTYLRAGYNFIQDVRKKFKIAIGINAGAVFSKLDGSKLVTPQGSGSSLNDALLSNQMQKSIRPDLSLGISFIHKYVEAGLVYTNLLQAKDKFKGDSKTLNPQYGGVLEFYAGSKISVSENFSVRPSILLQSDFKEFQTDLSFQAGYKEYIFLGINVRGYNKKSFESLSPIVSVSPVKNLVFVYSYDVSLSRLSQVNKGSHEITLKYFLPNNRIYNNPKVINNPRFL